MRAVSRLKPCFSVPACLSTLLFDAKSLKEFMLYHSLICDHRIAARFLFKCLTDKEELTTFALTNIEILIQELAQSWSFVQSRRNLKFLPLTLNHNIHLINPTNLLLLPPLPQPTQLQISLHWWASWTTTLYRGY